MPRPLAIRFHAILLALACSSIAANLAAAPPARNLLFVGAISAWVFGAITLARETSARRRAIAPECPAITAENQDRPRLPEAVRRVLERLVLAALILAMPNIAIAQGSKRAMTPRQALAQLETAKERFESDREKAARKVLDAFDALAEAVDRDRTLTVVDRATIQKDLRFAREAFDRDRTLRPIPELQPAYATYILTVRKSYYGLLAKYERALRLLPSSDERKAPLEEEVADLARTVNRLDLFQPGRTWLGYRADFNAGPHAEPDATGRRYRLVPDQPVNVEFTLRVDSRKGDTFEGEITQNGGAFRAEVHGTFDGVNLRMKMVRMLHGAPRQFEYAGRVVGSLGMLNLRGIKADGKYTEGEVALQLRN